MRGGRSVVRTPLRAVLAGETIDTASPAGPLDGLGVTPVGAWSVGRRLARAYDGPLIRLRRENDDAESDFGAGDDGRLDLGAIEGWRAGAAARVVKVYDQSPTGADMVQTTAGNQPGFSAAGCGARGRPGFAVASGEFLSALHGALDDLWAEDGFCVHLAYTITGVLSNNKFVVQKSNGTLFQNWYVAFVNTTKTVIGRCVSESLTVQGPSLDTSLGFYADTINSPFLYSASPTWSRNGLIVPVSVHGGVGAGLQNEAGVPLAWPARSSGQQTGVFGELTVFQSPLSIDNLSYINFDSIEHYENL